MRPIGRPTRRQRNAQISSWSNHFPSRSVYNSKKDPVFLPATRRNSGRQVCWIGQQLNIRLPHFTGTLEKFSSTIKKKTIWWAIHQFIRYTVYVNKQTKFFVIWRELLLGWFRKDTVASKHELFLQQIEDNLENV